MNPQSTQTLHSGEALETASAIVIVLHGRGGSASDMLGLAQELNTPSVAFLMPNAPGNTWYPNRFTVPRGDNQPYLDQSLEIVHAHTELSSKYNVPPKRIAIGGFSQGACLALEFAARRSSEPFGGVFGLSGGLIGADDELHSYPAQGVTGTPVFLGCSDIDAHIPLARVDQSATILAGLGAIVTKRIYPRMGHTVNEDEVAAVRAMIEGLVAV